LTQRSDDDLASFRKRHQAYVELTEPVADYYHRSGRLRRVSGTGTPEGVFQQVKTVLAPD
jgi:adenylate kinase family enzyme